MRNVLVTFAGVVAAVLAWIGGAPGARAAEPAAAVVLYTSIDEPYVRPLMKEFEKKTGIAVKLVVDSEATKTAGLVEKIQAEKGNAKADVYWGNEPFHTINLAKQGVLTPYQSPAAADILDRWRDKDWNYVCVGMRARTIAFSTRPQYAALVGKIKGIMDLTNPALKGKIGICHPGFGTASGHFAAMYMVLGEGKYTQLMQGLKANQIKLLGGNSVVAEQVAAGTLAAGPTDTDDVANGKAEEQKIDGVIPDQDAEGGMGTLLIPTTVALVNGAPHAQNAKKLIDFLLVPEVEKGLIEGRYLAYSVRGGEKQVKAMNVDYVQVAANMRKAIELALTILQER